jgi:hypothetical protein
MKKSISDLKNYFKTGDRPTQQQFYDFLESYLHLDSYILASQVTGLEEALTTLEQLGISDVIGLQTALNNLNTAITNLEVSDVSGLQAILDSLSSVSIGDIQGLQETLNNLASRGIGDIIGLTDALNGKVDKITGYGLSQNDFSNYYLGLITTIQNAVTALTYEGIVSEASIVKTISLTDVNKRIVFSNANPTTLTVPTDASVAWYTGTKIKGTVQGNGSVTISGAGITFVGNALTFPKGESFILTNIALNVWNVEGNAPASGAKIPYTVFIDTVNGSDVTGRTEDASFPFKTCNSAFSALPTADANAWDFVFLCDNVTRILNFPTTRKIKFFCYNSGTIDISQWVGFTTLPQIYIEAPFCSLIATIPSNSSLDSVLPIHINVLNITVNATNVQATLFNSSSLKSFYSCTNVVYNNTGSGRLFGKGTFNFISYTSNKNMFGTEDSDFTIKEIRVTAVDYLFIHSEKFKGLVKITGSAVWQITVGRAFDITNLETDATTVIFPSQYSTLTGKAGIYFLGIIQVFSPLSGIVVKDFYGKMNRINCDGDNFSFTVINSTILVDDFLFRNMSFSGTRTIYFNNVEIIRNVAGGSLITGSNPSSLFNIVKTGFVKSNGVFDAQTTFTDKTPNSF